MITALVILDRLQPRLQNNPPAFCELGGQKSAFETVLSTVLRGPFAVTVVAAIPELFETAREQLQGFSAHPLQAKVSHSVISEGLHYCDQFRQRWEKAMAQASARFVTGDDDEDEDEDEDDEPNPTVKRDNSSPAKKADWKKHRESKDVNVRGLARSFDRDGVILFRAERPLVSLNLQSQLVEAFGREGAEKSHGARPFAQAVYSGQRGYPLLMSVEAAREVAELPAQTVFDAWLLTNVERVQDVKTDDWGAVAQIDSAESLAAIAEKMRKATK